MDRTGPDTQQAGRNGVMTAIRAILAKAVDHGTQHYPEPVRRRLRIMNIAAYYVAAFTLVYTLQQVLLDFQAWRPVILVNLGLAAAALAVPFLHRFSAIAGVLTLGIAESAGLFALTWLLGRESGLHIQYIAAICVYFLVIGLERIRLIVALSGLGFALHVLAWALFPQEKALLTLSTAELNAVYVTASTTTFTIVAVVIYYAFRLAEDAQAESDALLHNILPAPVVDRLKRRPPVTIADEVPEGTVLFADLTGFVSLAKALGPARCVELLGTIVHAFDALADRWGVEKIKTIGDGYMAAAGVTVPAEDHAARMAGMAMEMHETLGRISSARDIPLTLRIGIATGPILAGVIGARRLSYDVWGDTVNLASRLEGASRPGRILVSQSTKARLDAAYAFESCGAIEIKGYGVEETWFLTGPAQAS